APWVSDFHPGMGEISRRPDPWTAPSRIASRQKIHSPPQRTSCEGLDVERFGQAVVFLEEMDPEAALAERDARADAGLHGAAVVVIDGADFFMLGMMGVAAEDYVGAVFFRVRGGAFGDHVDRARVVFAVVFQIQAQRVGSRPEALNRLVEPGSPF